MFLRETQGGDFVSSHRPLTPPEALPLGSARDFGPWPFRAIQLVTLSYSMRVFIREWISTTMDNPKSCGAEGVEGAIGKPPPRALRRETPAD